MNVLVENQQRTAEIKVGDIVFYESDSTMAWMITKYENGYSWLNLCTGYHSIKTYESILDLLEEDFDNADGDRKILSSEDYMIKIVKK